MHMIRHIRKGADDYEANSLCEAERKRKERKARAKGSSSESSFPWLTCSMAWPVKEHINAHDLKHVIIKSKDWEGHYQFWETNNQFSLIYISNPPFTSRSIYEPPHDKTNKMACAPSKDSVRPVWSDSSLSLWRKLRSLATDWAHSEDWSDWTDAQDDLSLRWAHRSFCWFCQEAAHIFPHSPEVCIYIFTDSFQSQD